MKGIMIRIIARKMIFILIKTMKIINFQERRKKINNNNNRNNNNKDKCLFSIKI